MPLHVVQYLWQHPCLQPQNLLVVHFTIDGIRATSQAEVAIAMKGRGSAEWQERLLTVLSALPMKIYLFCFSSTYFVVRFCSSWIFCTSYVCIPNVSLVVETASPLHACTLTVPCAHLLFSPLKSFSTSIASPFHTL